MQTPSSHQFLARPAIRLIQQAGAIHPDIADLYLTSVALFKEAAHCNESGEEAQGVTHDAEQLGVVSGSRHHLERVHGSSSFLTNNILAYTCKEGKLNQNDRNT